MTGVRRLGFTAGAALYLALLVAQTVTAETVIRSARIGNNSEGATYVSNGRWKDHVVVIDGNDVIAMKLRPTSHDEGEHRVPGRSAKKIFDVLPLGKAAQIPRSVVYVPTVNQFLFGTFRTTTLFRTDENGTPLPPLPLGFPPSIDPSRFAQYEGMTWIPEGAPAHANTIAALVIDVSFEFSRVWYIRPDGTVEAEVVPTPATPLQDYLVGITYLPQSPGTLLVTPNEPRYGYEMDLNGNYLGGPVLDFPGANDIENLVSDEDGRIFAADYGSGQLAAFDPSFARQPAPDRRFVIGLGVSAARITWDDDSEELLVRKNSPSNEIDGVPLTLDETRTVLTLDLNRVASPYGISCLGRRRLAVANRFFPRGVEVVNLDDGSEVTRLVFQGTPDFPLGPAFAPLGVGAFRSGELAVRVVGDRNNLKIVSSTGTPNSNFLPNAQIPSRLPDLPLSAPAIGWDVQFFDDGSGVKLFTGGAIYDVIGTLLHTVDQSALGLIDGAGTATWIEGNTYAAVDSGTSTVVIFTIP